MNYKILLFLCSFSLINSTVFTQVKIGDNPTVIDANSLVEMESATKGFLGPRVPLSSITSVAPLTGTVPEGMLVYSIGGTLQNGFYYWNGIRWVLMGQGRSKYVLVKTVNDFPAPVAGVITLATGTLYEVNGSITMTSMINLNGNNLIGKDAGNDKLIYTPGTGSLFTGASGGTIKQLTLTAPTTGAKLFNIDALGVNTNFFMENCYLLGNKDIGLIKGFGGTVFIETMACFSNTAGFTFQDNQNVLLSNMLWDISNFNTYEKFVGTFGIIQIRGGVRRTSLANTVTALDISGITSLTVGEVKVVMYTGTGTYVNGTFSNAWEVESSGISTEKDDVATGNMYLTTPVTTTFSGVNTPTKVLGTTTAVNLFRVTSPASNRLTYAGAKTRSFVVTGAMSITSSTNNNYYTIYIAKNGVIQAQSAQTQKIANGADQGAFSITCTVTMAPNDYIELWISNNTSTASAVVQTSNIAIK
jgi:hypothetical protein